MFILVAFYSASLYAHLLDDMEAIQHRLRPLIARYQKLAMEDRELTVSLQLAMSVTLSLLPLISLRQVVSCCMTTPTHSLTSCAAVTDYAHIQ